MFSTPGFVSPHYTSVAEIGNHIILNLSDKYFKEAQKE